MMAQIVWFGYTVAEVSCPTKYFSEASSINFSRSIEYGVGCLKTACAFRLAKMNLKSLSCSPPSNTRLIGKNVSRVFFGKENPFLFASRIQH